MNGEGNVKLLRSREEKCHEEGLKVVQCQDVRVGQDFLSESNFFNDSDFINSECSKSVYYFNYSREPLEIVERSDVRRTILPNTNNLFKGLVVKVVYKSSKSVKVDTYDLSDSYNLSERITHEGFVRSESSYSDSYTTLYYIYSEEDIVHDFGTSSYLKELDIVVGSGRKATASPHHPYSSMGMYNRYISTLPVEAKEGTYISFLLADSSGKIGTRFTNFNGNIIRIDADHNSGYSDGLYLYSNKAADGEVGTKKLFHHLSLEELDSSDLKILFKTYDQAKTKGDDAFIKEMEKLKKENDKLNREQELEKAKHESKMHEVESRIRTEEHRKQSLLFEEKIERMRKDDEHRRQQEMSRIKDHYEVKSHSRKDSTETIKTVGAIAGAIGGLFILYKKFGS